ncbi:MAG: BamA/TamA family outer membrane protein [Chitinophagaceae bacterium]|nr:BamA/TamA family outer membrane protein [Chitinophagaceae bacterium]
MKKPPPPKFASNRLTLFLLCLLSLLAQTEAQEQKNDSTPRRPSFIRRQINRVFNDTAAENQPSFTYYPSLGYAPETGVEMGGSILKLFRAKKDINNRLSEIKATGFFTFKAQYGAMLENAIYGDKDKWFFLGRTTIQRFPLFYYGIGSDAKSDNYAVVDAHNIIFRQRVLRKVKKNFFIGPEIDFQALWNVDFKQPQQQPHPLPVGSNGSTNLGLGVALVYDTRHNVLNVRQGLFAELAFLQYAPAWGSDFRFRSINLDLRSYHKVSLRNTIAWQVYGTFLQGEPPFNQLALMGGDMTMRGYYQGRFRDKNLIGTQTEFRMLPFAFHKRFGATVFAGAAVVGPKIGDMRVGNVRYSGGFGIRYLLFPKKDIFLRFDIGFTTEGANYYFHSGEAF